MRTKKVNNNDIYYNKTTWWFDENNEDSFSMFDLDTLYDGSYFKDEHLTQTICNEIVIVSKKIFHDVSNRELKTVLELGSGGGWITTKYQEHGIDVTGIEGSSVGYEKCVSRGIKNMVKADLRLPLELNRKFDLVISTEVAEHIEPPFVSTYVSNLVSHSDLIWFSYNSTDAHSNHHNCMPEKYWINLFGFFDFDYYKVPVEYKNKFNHRLNGFFFNPNTYKISDFKL